MSNTKKIALSAAIILSTGFSALIGSTVSAETKREPRRGTRAAHDDTAGVSIQYPTGM